MRARTPNIGLVAFVVFTFCLSGHSLGEEDEYRVSEVVSDAGTSRMGGIFVQPKLLTTLFGTPILDNGDPECMGIFKFVGPGHAVVTIYYRVSGVPRDQIAAAQPEFWANENKMIFDVGAKSQREATRFIAWVLSRSRGMASNKSPERTRAE